MEIYFLEPDGSATVYQRGYGCVTFLQPVRRVISYEPPGPVIPRGSSDKWQDSLKEEEGCKSTEEKYINSIKQNLPDTKRAQLPLTSDRYYSRQGEPISYDDIEGRFCGDKYQKEHLIQEFSTSVVNDKRCYYEKKTFSCPKCGETISFVDVTTIRFLDKEDNEETSDLSFLELSEVPAECCPKCGFHFITTVFDLDKLKRTVSYRLVQILKQSLAQTDADITKNPNPDCPMPANVERSVKFVESKIMLGIHGYSYVVNTYECCHCHRQYNICDLNTVRKEPYFVPKELREGYIKLAQIEEGDKRFRERIRLMGIHKQLKEADRERSILPREQWALPPYCLECGYNLYSYDLLDGEPEPSSIIIPNDNSLNF